MTDAIHEEVDDVAATMNAWRASVPSAVAFAPPLAADDAATAAVLAGMADWPVEHHAMGEHRSPWLRHYTRRQPQPRSS
ncbi:hypothetical protein [Mycobacterium kansasii]|uniref:hypothetical protein n=1 Tax=Mycobacterium kansasii TaxID=1768 RepID=UPI000CDD8856|nr:hypothetical protein [Mycobacterium kansasii]POY28588.1 hypothetical protein C3478_25160 [Mycobacterium kansasii]